MGLGREWARQGHGVTHISRAFRDLPMREVCDGVEHRRVRGYDTPRSLAVLKLLDLAYSLRALKVLPDADILFTNTFWMPITARAPRVGKVYVNVNRYPRGQMRFYKRAARLQAVSGVVGDAIRAQAPQLAEKVKVIPNSLPEGWTLPLPNLTQPRERWILYVGRVHPEKGIGLLLDAFARAKIDGWRLVVVGPHEVSMGGGGEDYLRQLKRQAEPIADRVDWIGPVLDSDTLKTYYERASLFVYPSLAARGESFGLAPLEAMARGCVPIVSNLACFRDYLEPSRNGFVFNHEAAEPAEELAAALVQAARKEDALTPLRECGVETASRFTVSKIAEQFLADFNALLKNN